MIPSSIPLSWRKKPASRPVGAAGLLLSISTYADAIEEQIYQMADARGQSLIQLGSKRTCKCL
ncbi:hypothetical protein HMPREF0758_4942, partial [Serratia odorifera DSM 4582]